MDEKAAALREQITAAALKLHSLKAELANLEAQDVSEKLGKLKATDENESHVTQGKWPLSSEEYKRYGRQMIVPNIGIQGWFAC